MKKKKSIISEWYSKIGRKGGLASSEAKAAAVRANGKLGGRPRKVVTV
jgi:hypothetical protein